MAEPGLDCVPGAWSRDASQLIYACGGDRRNTGIYIRSANDSSPPEELMSVVEIPAYDTAMALSPDQSTLLLFNRTERHNKITLLPVKADKAGERAPRDLPELAGTTSLGFSPDGNWLAYISDVSGRDEAYVRRFHIGGHLGPENPVSVRGAFQVAWSKATPQEPFDILITRPGVGKVYAVSLRSTPSLTLSRPREVLNPELLKPSMRSITNLPDGRWFGIQRGNNEGDTNRISIVLNWRQGLERRLPAR